jgi:hypothetical protein
LDKRDFKAGQSGSASAKAWKPTKLGVRGANGYQIWGIRYEEVATGEIAWQITIHPKGHAYWVSRGEFFSVSMDLFHNFTNTTLVQVRGTIMGLDLEEKESVLAAIERWQRPKNKAAAQH